MKAPTFNRMPRSRASLLRATREAQEYTAWLTELGVRADAGDPEATAQRERHVAQMMALERARRRGK